MLEVLKQVLEALMELKQATFHPAKIFAYENTIISLRQAIAELEKQEPVAWMYRDKSTHEVRFQKNMRDFVDHSQTSEIPLYSEPLANHELQCVCGAVWCGDEMVHLPNKTFPPQPLQQEPVAWLELLREARDNCKASIVEDGISADRKEYRIDLEARLTAALNASPQPRKPLTNEEIDKIWATHSIIQAKDRQRQAFARAIENAHGIKE